jgi:hypothetical protein
MLENKDSKENIWAYVTRSGKGMEKIPNGKLHNMHFQGYWPIP